MNRKMLLVISLLVLAAAPLVPAATAQQTAWPMAGFVLNEDGNSISVFDPQTGQIVITHDFKGVLDRPHLSAYDPSSHMLYVGNKGSNFVVFDMSDVLSPKVIANVKPGGNGEIHRVVLAGGLVWLAHQGDSAVYAYDLNDFSAPRLRLGPDKGFNTTHGLAVHPGTNELWVTNRPLRAPGFVLRIDLQTRSVIGAPLLTTGKEGDQPNNVEFTPDGQWAYVVNTGSKATEVTLVDATKFEVVKQIKEDPTVGMAPHAITFDPVTRRMFVVNKDSPTLTAIDTRTNTILGYFSIGAEPHGVTLGPDGQIYATAKKGNKIVVFNPRSLAVIRDVPGFVGPHQIIFTVGFAQPTATPVPPTVTPIPTSTPEPASPPVIAAQPPAAAPQVEVAGNNSPAQSASADGAALQTPGMPRTGASNGPADLALAVLTLGILAAGALLRRRAARAR